MITIFLSHSHPGAEGDRIHAARSVILSVVEGASGISTKDSLYEKFRILRYAFCEI